jgi:hypothetical protein
VGALAIASGLVISAWGVFTAVTRARPISLAGGLAAAAGLVLAFLGALRIVAPGMF